MGREGTGYVTEQRGEGKVVLKVVGGFLPASDASVA